MLHEDRQYTCLKKTIIIPFLILYGINPVANAFLGKQQPVNEAATSNKIQLKGITLTPGCYFAGEAFWRSRNEEADVVSTFSGIPMKISPLAHMNEFRLSARSTRFSLLVEGNYKPTLLSGYVEIDFLGRGTANSVETNSFNPRIRNLYAALDQKETGWHILAGQNWSLATTNSKGITLRNEVIPPTIDFQYVVGYVWKRQPQFRLTKDFWENVWAAISIENPQTTFSGIPTDPFGNVVSVTTSAPGAIALPSTIAFSLNHIPDVIAKLALEEILAEHNLHLDLFGIYRNLYDHVEFVGNINKNKDKSAGGVGAGAVLEVIPKRLNLQGNMLFGKGIGSYASGMLPDATIRMDGSLSGISEIAFMIGATLQATKCLDLYVFGGVEKEKAKFFATHSTFFGIGIPTANNATCNIENAAAAGCTGATRKLWQVTGGLWDKIYQGYSGEFTLGLQYSYTRKELFAGINDGHPSTDENMVFTSVRYYPFKVAS